MTDKLPAPIVPAEGWHVMHLFYKVEQAQWSLFSQEEQFAAKTRLTELIAEIRATEKVQLLTFAMVSPKADLGFMLLGPICTRSMPSRNGSAMCSGRTC
jgi:chlorite dismutase